MLANFSLVLHFFVILVICSQIFVEENGGAETTTLAGLKFFGRTIHNFDMNAIKKVG
jgi:hypothetical protein